MRIAERLKTGAPAYSFEFFPPKTPEAVDRLYETVTALKKLRPTFVSVTYGAGGSTRELTVDLVTRMKHELGVEAMAHLTCVGHTRDELAAVLDRLAANGIENVLALRGDPPRGQTEFVRPPGGFGHAQELARFIAERHHFCLAGAAYPEKHIEAPDLDTDLAHLREKVESGVEFLITQLFFEPDRYFRFVDRARAIGIDVPIVPGIMPITNVAQIHRFTAMCGASIPEALRDMLDRVKDDDTAVVALGVEWALDQCRRLLAGGAPGIHFYTLNRSHSAQMILDELRTEGERALD
ncbi:MAG TPA: methylenetetrahydrofolate reductase [NAD(P)H] [Candidatus Limnocylindria bacterium]|nr:methylenetetrahydrofolate reductase [NAD(P)H] [Candidatus Limnocylindria bacterium]